MRNHIVSRVRERTTMLLGDLLGAEVVDPLDRPRSLRERGWQRLVVYGLAATGALEGPDTPGPPTEEGAGT